MELDFRLRADPDLLDGRHDALVAERLEGFRRLPYVHKAHSPVSHEGGDVKQESLRWIRIQLQLFQYGQVVLLRHTGPLHRHDDSHADMPPLEPRSLDRNH